MQTDFLYRFPSPRRCGQLALSLLALSACTQEQPVDPAPKYSPYIAKVFEYRPAPGQFINLLPPTQADAAAKLEGSDGSKGMVSLGAFGGYIVFGFDHGVPNRPGKDLALLGNGFDTAAEPGVVQVSRDVNGNGLPDDPWYELAGAAQDRRLADYRVTYYRPAQPTDDVRWTDNQGGEGVVRYMKEFKQQPHYPAWEGDSYTLAGSRLPDNASKQGDTWVLQAFGWGYADEQAVGQMDLDWAVDAQGKPVQLSEVHFVRVHTAVQQCNERLGESSTELRGAADLWMVKAEEL